jgi:hypothetical protein
MSKGSWNRPGNQKDFEAGWERAFGKSELEDGKWVDVSPTGTDERVDFLERIDFLTKQRNEMAVELEGCRALIRSLREELEAAGWITRLREKGAPGPQDA